MFKNKSYLSGQYEDMCVHISNTLTPKLKDHVPQRNLDLARFIISDKLFHSILPFRVWNLMFLCVKSQYEINMCRFCTKIYIKHKQLSDCINNNLSIQINENIAGQLSYGIGACEKINLYTNCLG